MPPPLALRSNFPVRTQETACSSDSRFRHKLSGTTGHRLLETQRPHMLCVAAWVWFCLSTEFIVVPLVGAPHQAPLFYLRLYQAGLCSNGTESDPRSAFLTSRASIPPFVLRSICRTGPSGCMSMQRYWSSLLRYCPRHSVFRWLPIFVHMILLASWEYPSPLYCLIPPRPPTTTTPLLFCSRASVLETLLTAQTGLVLPTATYRRQKRSTQTDTKTSTP